MASGWRPHIPVHVMPGQPYWGGREVTGVDVLHEVLDALDGDGSLTLTVVRGTDEHELRVPFGPRAEEPR